MSAEFSVELTLAGGVGVLSWTSAPSGDALAVGVLASTSAAFDAGVRRVHAEVLASDEWARRALHRAGFRREGRLRAATDLGEDILVYGLLRGDVTDGPDGFSAVLDSVLPTKRVIGHAVARNHAGEVLLLETNYKSDWELPGGVIEPGESPRHGTIRELMEELGIEVDLGQPAIVDWMPPYLGWSDAIEFIFDLDTLSPGQVAALRPQAEILACHWVPAHRVARHVTELSARRIALVLTGGLGMTEAGYRT